jgi:hypothetical protein
VATHPLVHKFDTFTVPVKQAGSTSTAAAHQTTETPDAPAQPILTREREKQLAAVKTSAAAPSTTSSRQLKDALINEQLTAPLDSKLSRKEQKKAARLARTKRRFRAPTLVTAALAVMLLGGYVAYVNMPSISVRVAANHAGVDARNPHVPSGYSIDGPIAYSPGQVTIKYKSNGGGDGYSFTQANSAWNDNAVRDNLVKTASQDYETLVVGDLTIYRYGDRAAWINDGVLYTLNGNDHLGNNQILEIANSI